MMIPISRVLPYFLVLAALPVAASAATDLAQEYEQVRKIALRDPHVKEAFDRANERLESKIVELDPALRGYHPGRETASTTSSRPAPQPFVAHTAPEKKTVHSAAPASASGDMHVVAPGETIASIAARYHVSQAKLEEVNHVSDPRKLQVGQKLVIPHGASGNPGSSGAQTSAAPSKPSAAAPATAPDDGIWDKIKKSF